MFVVSFYLLADILLLFVSSHSIVFIKSGKIQLQMPNSLKVVSVIIIDQCNQTAGVRRNPGSG